MLNEEQILDICLKFVSADIRNLDYGNVKEFLVYYTVKNNPNIKDEEIMDKIMEYLFHHASSELINDDSLEIDFDENGELKYIMGEKFYQNTYIESLNQFSNALLEQNDALSKIIEIWEQMPESDRLVLIDQGYLSPESIIADQ